MRHWSRFQLSSAANLLKDLTEANVQITRQSEVIKEQKGKLEGNIRELEAALGNVKANLAHTEADLAAMIKV